MAWTPIVRHHQIKHDYSPYNKELKEYFNKRNKKEFDKNNVAYRQKLAKKQGYKCPLCGMSITDFKEGLETHHKIPKTKGVNDEYKNLELVLIEYHKLFTVKENLPDSAQLRNCLKYIKNKKLRNYVATLKLDTKLQYEKSKSNNRITI